MIIDTNVIASATFWQGVPQELLKAVFRGSVDMIMTREIVAEYERVLLSMARRYDSFNDASDVLDTIKKRAGWCTATTLPESVCDDEDDDKFIAAAIASQSPIIISGNCSHPLLIKFTS
ncbi:MAG: putative toxin-antitoxin system toxin component, PIN family [Gammaproteobacteria bacterium]|nr:putative toxin-antitoxin system toxin component, PIN family [Gammaproteobacteria bacterium]